MSDRLLRINEAVREVLGEAIGDLSDPRIGFVTVTSVRVARDFRSAIVFVSVLGDEKARERSLAGLRASHGVLQRAVARHVKLRNTPQLQFTYDDTTDAAMRINELLEEQGS